MNVTVMPISRTAPTSAPTARTPPHKPVALAGASSGMWGGVRAVEALVGAVREMGMSVTFTDVYFPKVQDIFSETGELLNPFYQGSVEKAYKELIWMAHALKTARVLTDS